MLDILGKTVLTNRQEIVHKDGQKSHYQEHSILNADLSVKNATKETLIHQGENHFLELENSKGEKFSIKIHTLQDGNQECCIQFAGVEAKITDSEQIAQIAKNLPNINGASFRFECLDNVQKPQDLEKLVIDIIEGRELQSSIISNLLSWWWGYYYKTDITTTQWQGLPSQYQTNSPDPDDNLKYFMPELAGKIQLLNQDNQPHDSVLGEVLVSNQ